MTKGAKLLAQLFDKPTQKTIAKQLAISEPTLSLLAAGKTNPSLALAGRIQDELGIPMDAWVEEMPA